MDSSVKKLLAVVFKDSDGTTIRYQVTGYNSLKSQRHTEISYECSEIIHDVLLRSITIKFDGGYDRVYFVQPPYMFTEVKL